MSIITLTKLPENTESDQGDKVEPKVTPEMIEAGVSALLDEVGLQGNLSGSSYEELVTIIYRAMARAA